MDLNVIPKRSKYKKKTESYTKDNVFDIIDIEECISKNKYIPKVPIDLFENIELSMEDIEGLSGMI